MKIDIDELFDEYLSEFIDNNSATLSASEIEKRIVELYEEFSSLPNEALGGLTPIEYYSNTSTKDLISIFEEEIIEKGSVSDVLCRVLEKRVDAKESLLKFAFSKNEELSVYAINVLGAMGQKDALITFVEVLSKEKLSQTVADVMTEAICLNADLVKEEVLKVYKPTGIGAECFEEILSYMSSDERVFKILCANFLNDGKKLAINASYLAKYGDDRALSILYSTIKRKDISLIDYSEIKNAIEKLGGEVEDDGRFLSH